MQFTMSRGWHSPFGPSLAFGHSRATHILSLRAERGLTWASSSIAVGHLWTSAQGDRHSGGSDFLSLERGSFQEASPKLCPEGEQPPGRRQVAKSHPGQGTMCAEARDTSGLGWRTRKYLVWLEQ